jgi:Putative phage tail protein
MGLGQSPPQPKKVNNIRVNQSTQGYPIPVVMGQAKIQQYILDIGPFVEQPVSSGGGKGVGGGGKNGATSYNYFTMVQAALCNGPVTSLCSAWSGQTWLQASSINSNITITEHYSPQNQIIFENDMGVAFAQTYDASYSDYGLPASTVLSGTDYAPLVYIPWFVSGTAYAVGNQVFNGTDVYTCKVANTGEALSNGTYWTNSGSGLTTGEYSISLGSLGTITLSSVANASGGTTTYTGSSVALGGISGASNGLAGFTFNITGFSNPANNGLFLCTGSSSTTLVLANDAGVSQSHAASAADVGNTYHFSSADVGTNAVVSFQFDLAYIEATDVFLVPSGAGGPGLPNHSVLLSQQYVPTIVKGVTYYGEDNANQGQSLTQVSGTPTEAGTYQVFDWSGGNYNPNNPNQYPTYVVFSSADAGQEVLVDWGYVNQSAVGGGPHGGGGGPAQFINGVLYGGNMGQAVNTEVETGGTFSVTEAGGPSGGSYNISVTGNPGQVLGYTGIAHVDYLPAYAGEEGDLQNNVYEIITPDAYGGGIVDCNPVQCMYRVLTDIRWGLGNRFPIGCIDGSSNGTWGTSVSTGGTRSVNSTAWTYFAANNFFISPVIDSQDTAASVMSKWLEAGMCGAYMSEGLLKLCPIATVSVAGNGCTWEAPQDYVVAFDDDDFLDTGNKDRIKVKRTSAADAFNKVQISFDDRTNQYFDDLCQEWDQAAINRYGEAKEDPQKFDFIHTLAAARFTAIQRVKRLQYDRGEYTFNVPLAYGYVECGDPILVTTSSIWAAGNNNLQLGFNNVPMRVKKIVDTGNVETGLEITCEDYPAVGMMPVLNNKGNTSVATANQFAPPGDTEAILFEPTSRLNVYGQAQVWIGVTGVGDNWGSCNVYVSDDDTSYLMVGTIGTAARLGTLVDSLPTGDDPDTVNSLVVQLEESCPALDAGTTTDADNLNTMCFVDGEIIGYSACTATGQNQYTMDTYLRRGQVGTNIESHVAGAAFMRLDSTIFKYAYDPRWVGQTLYFKFQSVNKWGNSPQPLSSLTPVSFVVNGLGPGSIDAASGITINQTSFNIGAGLIPGVAIAAVT